MTTKCFGYKKGDEDLKKFNEITIQSNPRSLIILSDFFKKCAEKIEKDNDWEHEHFNDFLPDNDLDFDLIIYNK